MGSGARPVRVLLAKVGLDGHDRGVKIVARAAVKARATMGEITGALKAAFGTYRETPVF